MIVLNSLDADVIAAEAAPFGLGAEEPLEIAATDEHVGSTVVLLRG